MTWTRLSDTHFDELPREELSRSARLLDIELTVWSNRIGSDGIIRRSALRKLTDASGEELSGCLAELTGAGLWADIDEGYQYTGDWAKDQRLAEVVEADRAKRAAIQDRYRDRTKRCAAGDHSMCDRCAYVLKHGKPSVDKSSTQSENVTGNVTGSSPDPTRPDLKGGDVEGRRSTTPMEGSADADLPPVTSPEGEGVASSPIDGDAAGQAIMDAAVARFNLPPLNIDEDAEPNERDALNDGSDSYFEQYPETLPEGEWSSGERVAFWLASIAEDWARLSSPERTDIEHLTRALRKSGHGAGMVEVEQLADYIASMTAEQPVVAVSVSDAPSFRLPIDSDVRQAVMIAAATWWGIEIHEVTDSDVQAYLAEADGLSDEFLQDAASEEHLEELNEAANLAGFRTGNRRVDIQLFIDSLRLTSDVTQNGGEDVLSLTHTSARSCD